MIRYILSLFRRPREENQPGYRDYAIWMKDQH